MIQAITLDNLPGKIENCKYCLNIYSSKMKTATQLEYM